MKYLKDGSGTKGLYGQQSEQETIELSRPEVMRLLEEFESSISTVKNDSKHPDSSVFRQKGFIKDLNSMLSAVQDGHIADPFDVNEEELITLDTREIIDPEIQRSLCSIEELGKTLRDKAVRERIELANKPISENIPRPGIYTFCNRPPADLKKGPSKISTAKANLSLVTKMFMNLQSQPAADIDDFFKHESSRDPPSIANKGKLYTGNKSD